MLREVCNCGASITADDPHTITQSRVEDWRANHRHEPAVADPGYYAFTHADPCSDDACRGECEQAEPPADSTVEPPPGTPVWWDGKWWFPDGVYYYDYCRLSMPKSWSEMPGAVPALTPQQMHDRYYVPGFSNGHARGRNDAARDIAAAREHAVAEHIALADKVSTEMLRKAEEKGQRDMLARAIEAVDAIGVDGDPRPVMTVMQGHYIKRDDALSALEALRALGGSDE
jgi:hypothetical protein